jgi:hypothetical protein
MIGLGFMCGYQAPPVNSTVFGGFPHTRTIFLIPNTEKSNLDNLLGGKHPVKLDHGGWGSIEL